MKTFVILLNLSLTITAVLSCGSSPPTKPPPEATTSTPPEEKNENSIEDLSDKETIIAHDESVYYRVAGSGINCPPSRDDGDDDLVSKKRSYIQ